MFEYLSSLANSVSNPGSTAGFTSIFDFLIIGVNIAMGGAFAISLAGIIYAGILYTSSRGDPANTAKARTALTYSIVAMLIAMGGFALKDILIRALGGDPGSFAF